MPLSLLASSHRPTWGNGYDHSCGRHYVRKWIAPVYFVLGMTLRHTQLEKEELTRFFVIFLLVKVFMYMPQIQPQSKFMILCNDRSCCIVGPRSNEQGGSSEVSLEVTHQLQMLALVTGRRSSEEGSGRQEANRVDRA